MKNKNRFTLFCAACAFAAPLFAQDLPPLPAIPSAPQDPGAVPPVPAFDPTQPFDPSQPFAAQPLQPLQPQPVPAPAPSQAQSAATLPLPEDQEMFDFFQPGYQYEDAPQEQAAPVVETPIEIAPPAENKAPKKLPLVRFNYKNQYLPESIYKKRYDRENAHLPKAWYPEDYDRAAFAAAARNNLSGVRALIESGRDVNMQNPQGETLAMVAVRHGAQDVLRYLLAKGADAQGAAPIAAARRNGQAFYALKTVE